MVASDFKRDRDVGADEPFQSELAARDVAHEKGQHVVDLIEKHV